MGFWSWLTGKSSGGASVDLQTDLAEEVVKNLNNISSITIANAASNAEAALVSLNSVNGISLINGYPFTFPIQPVFEYATNNVKEISSSLQADIDSIKDYSADKQPPTVLATAAMTGVSVLDGALSAIEELGDGVVSLFGWVTGADVSKFVETEWVHDKLLGGFYDSDFAKRSAFTEDSAIAGALRFTGNVASSIFIGGAAGKAAAALGKSTKLAKTAVGARRLLALGEGLVSGVSVTGAVTEAGLQTGKSFDEAVSSGAKWGAVVGLGAGIITNIGLKKVAAGKAAEKGADDLAGKAAEKGADDLAGKAAEKGADDLAGKAAEKGADDLAGKAAEKGGDDLAGKAAGTVADDVAEYNVDDIIKEFKSEEATKVTEKAGTDSTKYSVDDIIEEFKTEEAKAAAKGTTAAERKTVNAATREGAEVTGKAGTDSTKYSVDDIIEQFKKEEATAAGKGTEVTGKAGTDSTKYSVDDIIEQFKKEEATAAGKGTEVTGKAGTDSTKYSVDDIIEQFKKEEATAAGKGTEVTGKAGTDSTKYSVDDIIEQFKKEEATAAGKGTDDLAKNAAGRVTAEAAAREGAEGGFKATIREAGEKAVQGAKEFGEKAVQGAKKVGAKAVEVVKSPEFTAQAPGAALRTIVDSADRGNVGAQTSLTDPTQNSTTTTTTTTTSTENPFATDPAATDPSATDTVDDTYYGGAGPYYPGGGTYSPTPSVDIPTPTTEVETTPEVEVETVTPTETEVTIPTVTTQPIVTTTPAVTTPSATQTVTTPATVQPATVTTGGGSTGGGGTVHYGGGYTGTEGFKADELLEEVTEPELEELTEDASESIDEIINGTTNYTKIPTSSIPIAKPTSSSKGNAFIPIAAGLSAAAAAGLGAKAYLDRKKNGDNGEEEEYEDDWTDTDNIEIDEDQTTYHEEYLNDDYNNTEEKYDAKTNEELADIQ